MLLAAAGCRQVDRVGRGAPTLAELPTFEELESRLPITVGIEGALAKPRTIIVPKYDPIEPTPEERVILGEQQELQLDLLAFYRPPRTPEQGVSADSFSMVTGIGGVGGAIVGRCLVYPRYAQYGLGGRYAYQHTMARSGASVGSPRRPGGNVGRSWSVSVGENEARTRAQRASRAGT
jgi:hypothetical protein